MKKLVASETLILMALPQESQALFEGEGITIHYSGIGKVNATFKATELMLNHRFKQIVNLGTAGSQKFPAHSLVECIGFIQRDMDLSQLGFARGHTPGDHLPGLLEVEAISSCPKGLCGTGDSIELGNPKLACDVVDMEAYAIAKVCAKLGAGFHSFKYITDKSDENTRKDWSANLRRSAEALLRVYREITE
jgi:adenosylhomocysteine nucleosidase